MNSAPVLNSKVSPRFDKHANVLQVMENINKAMEGVEGINTRKRFTVKTGGKYVQKNTNPVNPAARYSLSDRPFYFYRETEAREAYRVFILKGRTEIESEIVQNN
jgi:hypothetical protein